MSQNLAFVKTHTKCKEKIITGMYFRYFTFQSKMYFACDFMCFRFMLTLQKSQI